MTINIDFDYTCVIPSHNLETIGTEIGAVPVLKRLVEEGHQLILFTCRSNMPNKLENGVMHFEGLNEAIYWFDKNDIPLYGVQINPIQHRFTSSMKSLADLMIDDTALGIPLMYGNPFVKKPYVDWIKVELLLEERGILKKRVYDNNDI